MKKILIIAFILTLVVTISFSQTKKQLPVFTEFKEPFFNYIGNGYMDFLPYDLIYYNKYGGFNPNEIYYYLNNGVFNNLKKDFVVKNKIKSVTKIKKNHIRFINKESDSTISSCIEFDSLGNINAIRYNDEDYIFNFRYVKDTIKIFVGDSLYCSTIFKNNVLIKQAFFRTQNGGDYNQQVPYNEKEICEVYYSYNKMGYPDSISFSANANVKPITFLYDFSDSIIKITKNHSLGKYIFYYDWNFRILELDCIYSGKLFGEFYHETYSCVYNKESKELLYIDIKGFGRGETSFPKRYEDKYGDGIRSGIIYFNWKNNKIERIDNSSSGYYLNNKLSFKNLNQKNKYSSNAIISNLIYTYNSSGDLERIKTTTMQSGPLYNELEVTNVEYIYMYFNIK